MLSDHIQNLLSFTSNVIIKSQDQLLKEKRLLTLRLKIKLNCAKDQF